MARCSRCGTTFNYEKREGICPKCCFYNRQGKSNSLDNEWTKNYSIDDSKYVPPTMEDNSRYDEEEKPELFSKKWLGKLKFDRSGECKTEGSHVHSSSDASWRDRGLASWEKMKSEMENEAKKSEESGEISRKTKKNIAIVLLIIYVVIMFIFGVLASLFSF